MGSWGFSIYEQVTRSRGEEDDIMQRVFRQLRQDLHHTITKAKRQIRASYDQDQYRTFESALLQLVRKCACP